MVISNNKDVSNQDFELLIKKTLKSLQKNSQKNQEKYLKLLGNKLEDEVFDILTDCSNGTIFENTIELVSGQKFPDIIANEFYGIEVKTTKQNHWKSTGNSVLESSRIEGIEKIYMLFGKIVNPIEFKCRPYQDCLSNVIVTHSPRYAIDMNLNKGETIFDKISIDYETIRKSNDPIKPFKNYYRSKLKKGQELWWIDKNEEKPSNIIFRTWNTINKDEKKKYKILGYSYFPEILSKSNTKFDNFTLWLSLKERIICPNVRDLFTAGGRKNIVIDGFNFNSVPKTVFNFLNNINQIIDELNSTSIEKLNEIWKKSFTSRSEINTYWIKKVELSIFQSYGFKHFNIKKWLLSKL